MNYQSSRNTTFFLAYLLLGDDYTDFKIGDVVSRVSHNNDIIFKIIRIDNNIAYLKGTDLRLYADSFISDLKLVNDTVSDDNLIIEKNIRELNLNRDKYFYLPGKVLHIDGDKEYLDRCMNFYKSVGIKVYGITLNESEVYLKIYDLISEYQPDIVVITGHDSYASKKNNINDLDNYENSSNFVKAINEARKYEKGQDKLIIIAGACQSNYESLIKAGANFASSPKRINIHALDPAIIACSLAFSDRNQCIDLISLLEKTKYGSDGIGGIITNGTMYVGYPR